jgi:hypothetical protein
MIWGLGGGLILATVAAKASFDRLGLPELLRRQAAEQGLELELGAVEHGLFSATLRNVKVRFRDAPTVNGHVAEVVLRRFPFHVPDVVMNRARFTISGEPTWLFDRAASIPARQAIRMTWPGLSVEYRHRLFEKVVLEDVAFERRDDGWRVNARRVALDEARWSDVTWTLARRNEMLEIDFVDPSPESRRTQLGYFPATRGPSRWALNVSHQPARALARRLGWDPGSAFDAASVGGTLTFVVPNDSSSPIRGLLQMTVDRYPKPNWPDAEAFLGNTASFAARVTVSPDRHHWELSPLDAQLSLFSLKGTGEVTLGSTPHIAFDIRGARTCAQIEGNAAPSSYLQRARAFLAQLPKDDPHRRDEMTLRLQLSTENAPTGQRHVAWQLTSGCGVDEVTEGSLIPLKLPAEAPVPPKSTHTDPHAP